MFGFGSKKDKSSSFATSSIAPIDYNRQVANYDSAQGLAPSYSATSGAQVQAQFNPYISQVIDQMMARQGEGERNALNLVGDRANAAHAFGGSRQGVAQGVALGQFQNDQNQQIAGLLAGGYQDAANRAQQENQFSYQYPLARQGLLNSTLAGITPTTMQSGNSTGKASGYSLSFGGGGGGGGGSSGGGGNIVDSVYNWIFG